MLIYVSSTANESSQLVSWDQPVLNNVDSFLLEETPGDPGWAWAQAQQAILR